MVYWLHPVQACKSYAGRTVNVPSPEPRHGPLTGRRNVQGYPGVRYTNNPSATLPFPSLSSRAQGFPLVPYVPPPRRLQDRGLGWPLPQVRGGGAGATEMAGIRSPR